MDELGSILREAREVRNITLDDAWQATKINPRFLQALEDGHYHELPTPVHVRGYLRNYARYLHLDARPLLERYEALSRGAAPAAIHREGGISAETPLPPREDNPFFNPVNMQINPNADGGRGLDSVLRIVIIVALIASIVLVASSFFLDDGRTFNLGDAFNTLINREGEPTVADLDIESMVANAEITPENPLIDTSRNQIADDAIPTPIPTIALNSIVEADAIELRLEITERTWLQVTVDDDIAYEGQAEGGELLEFTAQDTLKLKSGNAIGIFATLNGEELGKLGSRAQVLDHTWQIQQ
jgi:hypothetical protein